MPISLYVKREVFGWFSLSLGAPHKHVSPVTNMCVDYPRQVISEKVSLPLIVIFSLLYESLFKVIIIHIMLQRSVYTVFVALFIAEKKKGRKKPAFYFTTIAIWP